MFPSQNCKKRVKMAKNVQISIFPLVTFFGTYIRVTLAKFQLSRSIFVGGDTLNVNMEKIAFKGRKSQFWPKNDQILAKVNFLLVNPRITWNTPVCQILGILSD